jgi:hypothetical protein
MMRQRQLWSTPRARQAVGGLCQMRLNPVSDAAKGISYLFIAPLDAKGQIDVRLWHEMRGACRVFQIRADAPVRMGTLFHRRGQSWTFQYDGRTVSADDSTIRLDDRPIEPGRTVWIANHGVEAEYRVMSVEPICI